MFSVCNDRIILGGGDFNYYVDASSKVVATDFVNFGFSFNVIQHVSEQTHRCGHTLDLIRSDWA